LTPDQPVGLASARRPSPPPARDVLVIKPSSCIFDELHSLGGAGRYVSKSGMAQTETPRASRDGGFVIPLLGIPLL